MAKNIVKTGQKFHLELLVAKNYINTLIKLLENYSTNQPFISKAKCFPKFQVITEGSKYWCKCDFDELIIVISNLKSNKISRSEAIPILYWIQNQIQSEIIDVNAKIHKEFMVASNYVNDVINYLESCKDSGNNIDEIGMYKNKMPKFNYIGDKQITIYINLLCSGKIEISEAITALQKIEKAFNSALRTI